MPPTRERLLRVRAATSPRLTAAASLAASLAVVAWSVAATRAAFVSLFSRAIGVAATPDALAGPGALGAAATMTLRATTPMLVASLVAAVLVHALQMRATLGLADAARSTRATATARTAMMLVLIVAAAPWSLTITLQRDVSTCARSVVALLHTVAWRAALAALALGAIECVLRVRATRRALTPTEAERRREAREHEGDPQVRQRMRHRAG
jgi:flagellar biosynthesis protein FlhB